MEEIPESPAPQPQDADSSEEPETPPPAQPSTQPPAEAAQLSEAQARDLEFLRPILTNAASDPVSRGEAAVRLLAMNLPQATEILDEALRGGQGPVISAALGALHGSPNPPQELLAACLELLRGAPQGTDSRADPAEVPGGLDALARALVGYGDQALTVVAELAHNQDAPPAERLRAIRVMGAFRTPAGAAGLMTLLEPQRGETEEITCAACRSLERLSGSALGCAPDQWRQWWAGVRNLSEGEWNQLIVRVLTARIAELERAVESERARKDQVLRVLGVVYTQLFPVLGIEDQFNRLPAMLDDDLATVRRFALERIARIMRDSVPIPPAVQAKLVQRLQSDPLPDVRSRAAQLLDQQGYEGMSALLVSRLGRETDRQVVAVFLDVLKRRPSAEAIVPLTAWLGDQQLSAAAAEAVWAFPGVTGLPPDRLGALLAALRGIDRPIRTASHERLLALIGEDSDMTRLEALLDADDQAVRLAVAEGFVRRGRAQPLLDRAEDPLIRPLALRVLANGPAELPRFQTLVSLRSSNENDPPWQDAVRTLARRLPLADLLEADAVLAGLNRTPSALRVDALLPAAENPPEGATPEQRTVLLVRLTPLLMKAGRATKAHELLVQLNGVPSSSELQQIRFRAAALAMQWDAAAQLSNEPTKWVSALTWAVEFDLPSARQLRDEIARRFAEQMADDVRADFDAASTKLQERAPPPAPPAAGDAGSQPVEETGEDG